MADTSDDRVDEVVAFLQEAGDVVSEEVAELIHALRSERNMLAYEKGGHTLWKRYTQ